MIYRPSLHVLDRCHTCNFIAQLLFRIQQRSILCNSVVRMLWTLIGQFCKFDKAAVCDMHSCILQLCRAKMLRDKSRDKIACVTSVLTLDFRATTELTTMWSFARFSSCNVVVLPATEAGIVSLSCSRHWRRLARLCAQHKTVRSVQYVLYSAVQCSTMNRTTIQVMKADKTLTHSRLHRPLCSCCYMYLFRVSDSGPSCRIWFFQFHYFTFSRKGTIFLPWPWAKTYDLDLKLDLDMNKVKRHAKYLRQRDRNAVDALTSLPDDKSLEGSAANFEDNSKLMEGS